MNNLAYVSNFNPCPNKECILIQRIISKNFILDTLSLIMKKKIDIHLKDNMTLGHMISDLIFRQNFYKIWESEHLSVQFFTCSTSYNLAQGEFFDIYFCILIR